MRVGLFWEPDEDTNINKVWEVLNNHPEISKRLLYINGGWASKDSFHIEGYRLSDEAVAFCTAFESLLDEADEFLTCSTIMPISTNDEM